MNLSDWVITAEKQFPTHYFYELRRDNKDGVIGLMYVSVFDNTYLLHMPNKFNKQIEANSLEDAMGKIDEPQ